MTQTCCEIVWIIDILFDQKVVGLGLVDLYCDNKVAIQIASNPIFHLRTKHIEIDCHLVRDYLSKGIIYTKFTTSDTQLADVFTKALSSPKLLSMFSNIDLINWFQGNIQERWNRPEDGC